MPQKTVLFLCTGNYYRSRFAEILFNWSARQRGLNWIADSRGLRLEPLNPGPISRYTLDGLAEMGIEVDEPIRYPAPVTAIDLQSAGHVVAVKEAEHRPMIEQTFPEWLSRIEFWRVDDVDYVGPEIALPELRQNVAALVERLSLVK
jgi:low molecular weight protein-tyrosine phosphatase